jgi:hypothetical protein
VTIGLRVRAGLELPPSRGGGHFLTDPQAQKVACSCTHAHARPCSCSVWKTHSNLMSTQPCMPRMHPSHIIHTTKKPPRVETPPTVPRSPTTTHYAATTCPTMRASSQRATSERCATRMPVQDLVRDAHTLTYSRSVPQPYVPRRAWTSVQCSAQAAHAPQEDLASMRCSCRWRSFGVQGHSDRAAPRWQWPRRCLGRGLRTTLSASVGMLSVAFRLAACCMPITWPVAQMQIIADLCFTLIPFGLLDLAKRWPSSLSAQLAPGSAHARQHAGTNRHTGGTGVETRSQPRSSLTAVTAEAGTGQVMLENGLTYADAGLPGAKHRWRTNGDAKTMAGGS